MADFVIVDAYGFLFRAYYALPQLNTSHGLPVGGVYGFVNILLKHLLAHNADYLAVVFDPGSKNFRHKIYPEYKMNRPQLPEDLLQQFLPLREAVDALGIASEEVLNYEADDVIATLSAKYASENTRVHIITADKDLLQLLGENVQVFDPIKNRYLTDEYVLEKFGVTPDKLLDVFALTGDTSDNVPGVPSIGIKTAARLVNRFGSLNSILDNVAQIEQKKCREMLIQHADSAILSRNLVTLHRNVALCGDLSKYARRSPSKEQLLAFLDKYELTTLRERIEKCYQISLKCPGKPGDEQNVSAVQKCRAKSMEEFLSKYAGHSLLAFFADIEDGTINGISVSCDGEDVFSVGKDGIQESMKAIAPILASDSVLKIVYDAKLIMGAFPDLEAFDDIMLMSYSLGAGTHDHSLQSIMAFYLGKGFVAPVACMLVRLHKMMRSKLFTERLCTVYYQLERPLTRVLCKMQEAGIEINTEILEQLSSDFHNSISLLEQEIYQLAGCQFNIASSKQLGQLLFERMGLGVNAKKMPSGVYCTNAEVLTEFAADGVEIADKILKWRHFTKLKSTYVDGLLRQVETGTHRVHTQYSMVSTVTGRVSSSNPNLQNIPIRSKEGGEIRKAFVAQMGYKLVSADYSQMELRVLAHIAGVRAFIDAFSEGRDIHLVTAQQIFGDGASDPDLRRRAKSINFGIIYGMSPFGLAKSVGIPKKEASQYVDQYFRSYPEIKHYMHRTLAFASKHGYTRTVFGRKCYIVGIGSKRHAVKSFAERAAINAPIQGTAADILKKAMVRLHEKLHVGRMLLQVHDELLLEVPEAYVHEVARLVKEVMEGVTSFSSVPLTVDISVGDSWGNMEELKEL
ncbi:MAG: DNA polymerase I [Anaplasma sp.]